jgi:hypothetical protein
MKEFTELSRIWSALVPTFSEYSYGSVHPDKFGHGLHGWFKDNVQDPYMMMATALTWRLVAETYQKAGRPVSLELFSEPIEVPIQKAFCDVGALEDLIQGIMKESEVGPYSVTDMGSYFLLSFTPSKEFFDSCAKAVNRGTNLYKKFAGLGDIERELGVGTGFFPHQILGNLHQGHALVLKNGRVCAALNREDLSVDFKMYAEYLLMLGGVKSHYSQAFSGRGWTWDTTHRASPEGGLRLAAYEGDRLALFVPYVADRFSRAVVILCSIEDLKNYIGGGVTAFATVLNTKNKRGQNLLDFIGPQGKDLLTQALEILKPACKYFKADGKVKKEFTGTVRDHIRDNAPLVLTYDCSLRLKTLAESLL